MIDFFRQLHHHYYLLLFVGLVMIKATLWMGLPWGTVLFPLYAPLLFLFAKKLLQAFVTLYRESCATQPEKEA